jgi:hypothetical protein
MYVALKEYVNLIPSSHLLINTELEGFIARLCEVARQDPAYSEPVLVPIPTGFASNVPIAGEEGFMNPFLVPSNNIPLSNCHRSFSGTLATIMHCLIENQSQRVRQFAPPKNGVKLELSI